MAKISQKGENFKNRPVTPFLVTISDMKSIENRELPPFPGRAWLMGQTNLPNKSLDFNNDW